MLRLTVIDCATHCQASWTSAGFSRESKNSSVLRAAVRAFQLIRIYRLLKVRAAQ